MTSKFRLDRRRFLAGSAALAGAAVAAPAVLRAADRELRILTWEGYAEPEWLEPFKKATGATVNIVYSGSADEMFAKMQGSQGADFDLVSFDTSLFPRYVDAKLIQPFDMSKLTNFGNVAPEFQQVAAVCAARSASACRSPGARCRWSTTPRLFRHRPSSWEVMWDPQYAQQMLWQDDANNSITLAALILGLANPYQLTDDDFAKIKAKLIEQKKLLLSYYAGFDDGVNLFAQNGIKLMYSMGEPQVPALNAKGVKAALTIPKERAVGWLDCWELSVGAKDKDLALEWINACLDKAVGKVLTEKHKYGNTTNLDVNKTAGLTYGDKLSWLETAENYEKRVATWNEIKAG